MTPRSTYSSLLLCCLMVLCCIGCRTQEPLSASASAGTVRYRIWISRGQMEISGIAVVGARQGELTGSVINEFGVKAFDFVCQDRRCRLLHVVGPLNHWYIRRSVGQDLYNWLRHRDAAAGQTGTDGPRTWRCNGDGLELHNVRTGITYLFKTLQ